MLSFARALTGTIGVPQKFTLLVLLAFSQHLGAQISTVPLPNGVSRFQGASEPRLLSAPKSPGNTVSAASWRRQIPKEARKAYERGLKNFKQGYRVGLEAAAADLEQAILIDPNFAEAHGKLGLVYFRLERLHEAADEFRRVIALNPEVSEWHANLGWSLFGLGDDAGAMQCANHALGLDAGNSSAHLLVGSLLAAFPERRLESLWHLAEGPDSMKAAR